MSDDIHEMKRRTFLCVLGAAGLAAGCGDPTPAEPFSAGAVTDHPMNVWKLFAAQRVIVGRDANGFFAYTAVCTDAGTTIAFRDGMACAGPTGCTSQSPTGLTECPLHLSRFDGAGAAIRGPAASNLDHYQVTVAGGVVTVNPAAVVAASVRAA